MEHRIGVDRLGFRVWNEVLWAHGGPWCNRDQILLILSDRVLNFNNEVRSFLLGLVCHLEMSMC